MSGGTGGAGGVGSTVGAVGTVGTETVRAVNAMTARWARAAADGTDTALSAVGLWPLLAFLGGAADGPARHELAAALGVDADTALYQGRALLESLAAADGLSAALGVWTKREVELREQWLARLPAAAVGRLTGESTADRAQLDAWADRSTGGLIPRMPLALDPGTVMVLASALTVRTRWQRPFEPRMVWPQSGPWAGRRDLAGLGRTSDDLNEVRVAATPAGPLTVLDVRGDNGIDVHLLLGEPAAAPGAVLEAGVGTLAGAYASVAGDRLPEGTPGPGVNVTQVLSWERKDELYACTVAFTVTADHDLLRQAPLFGLVAATDGGRGHFPGVSGHPLAVSEARQAITASFTELGFEAAAVTVLGMRAGGVPQQRAKSVHVEFGRPFGFLAVQRATGLVLTAGWVAEPQTLTPGPGGTGW